MSIGWRSLGFLIIILLLAACSASQGGGPEAELNASANQADEQATPSPTPSLKAPPASKWDDRTLYAQNLNPSGQQFLDALPQASVYHIWLTIPENMAELLTGSLEVRYINQETVPLEEVYFRLFPNYAGGQLTVQNVLLDGEPAASTLESDQTSLRVALEEPLNPADAVVISMDYQLQLPETMGGNYGLLGYFENILVLDTFYPMIPAYDQGSWYAHRPYQNGDLTANDASFYLVEVRAPAELVLAASGSVVDESINDGMQTLTIAAGPARDFYLAGSPSFSVLSEEWNGIQVNSYALEGYQTHQRYALQDAIQALETFSDLFGPYPYRELDLLSSPMMALGIEYPGIFGILYELYEEGGFTYGVPNQAMLETVVVHEVGHQWFYNVVGNNQQSEPWVDEALTQFITQQYFVERYGDGAGSALETNWEDRWAQVENEDIPLGLTADEYEGKEYSAIIYGRGPIFYRQLEADLGRGVLLEGLRGYYQQHQWQVATTEGVRQALEKACGCDLGGWFSGWVYALE